MTIKEIVVTKTLYIAEDGKTFDNEVDCTDYENDCWRKRYENRFDELDYRVIDNYLQINKANDMEDVDCFEDGQCRFYLIKIHNLTEWNIAQVYFEKMCFDVDHQLHMNVYQQQQPCFPLDLIVCVIQENDEIHIYFQKQDFNDLQRKYQNIANYIDVFQSTK